MLCNIGKRKDNFQSPEDLYVSSEGPYCADYDDTIPSASSCSPCSPCSSSSSSASSSTCGSSQAISPRWTIESAISSSNIDWSETSSSGIVDVDMSGSHGSPMKDLPNGNDETAIRSGLNNFGEDLRSKGTLQQDERITVTEKAVQVDRPDVVAQV